MSGIDKTGNALKLIHEYEKPVKIMEVCGTHTSSIAKSGLYSLLPSNVRLVSGPGCPVCVTEAGFIDGLIEASLRERTCVVCFGDMMRVKGSTESFLGAQARGGAFRVVYSPLEAVEMARKSPETQFIVAAVGFEATIPVYALLLETLIAEGIKNVKLAVSLKKMIPAISYICENENSVDGFICPGHVSVIIGRNAYDGICSRYGKPLVIAGFELEQIMGAIGEVISQLVNKHPRAVNMYTGAVNDGGNRRALAMMDKYFAVCDGYWREIGLIEGSALMLRDEFSCYAEEIALPLETQPTVCRCADVLLGRITPAGCDLFGKACTPEHPVGPCMVSPEGACGIWHSNTFRGGK